MAAQMTDIYARRTLAKQAIPYLDIAIPSLRNNFITMFQDRDAFDNNSALELWAVLRVLSGLERYVRVDASDAMLEEDEDAVQE